MKSKIVRVKPGMRLDPGFFLFDVKDSIPVKKIKNGYYQVLIDSWENNGKMFLQRVTRNLNSLIPEYYRDAKGYDAKEIKGIYKIRNTEFWVVIEGGISWIEEQEKAIRKAFYQFAKKEGLSFRKLTIDLTCTDGCLLEGMVRIERRL